MEIEEWEKKGLDPAVIPLVKFFNDSGLKTYMSCQGHNQTNMSMFWIQFDKSVTEEDILGFMKKHSGKYGSFFSNGRFAKRLMGFHSVPDGTWKKEESWNYFAATVEAANRDFLTWQNDGDDWKGIDGKEFQELRNRYMERKSKKKVNGMSNNKLDQRFYPEVYQAVAGNNYTVYAYLNDGSVREFDVKPLIKQGGIFKRIEDETIFKNTLTVLNGTVAWDIAGNRNKYECIDIDPMTIFKCPVVPDFPEV